MKLRNYIGTDKYIIYATYAVKYAKVYLFIKLY